MNSMESVEIQEYLPHRYPFLLVDRVVEVESGDHIVGIKNVTINEPFFQGHFPAHPIMPGVLIIEALAQLSGILASVTKSIRPALDGYVYYLAGLDKTRFKRPVEPGDVLRMHSKVLHERREMMKFECNAFVDEDLVCTSELLVAGPKL